VNYILLKNLSARPLIKLRKLESVKKINRQYAILIANAIRVIMIAEKDKIFNTISGIKNGIAYKNLFIIMKDVFATGISASDK